MEKTRHFIVDTPVGQLAIYAKHDKTDCAADYPGVFIDYLSRSRPQSQEYVLRNTLPAMTQGR